jgi:hypothetical protein
MRGNSCTFWSSRKQSRNNICDSSQNRFLLSHTCSFGASISDCCFIQTIFIVNSQIWLCEAPVWIKRIRIFYLGLLGTRPKYPPKSIATNKLLYLNSMSKNILLTFPLPTSEVNYENPNPFSLRETHVRPITR